MAPLFQVGNNTVIIIDTCGNFSNVMSVIYS